MLIVNSAMIANDSLRPPACTFVRLLNFNHQQTATLSVLLLQRPYCLWAALACMISTSQQLQPQAMPVGFMSESSRARPEAVRYPRQQPLLKQLVPGWTRCFYSDCKAGKVIPGNSTLSKHDPRKHQGAKYSADENRYLQDIACVANVDVPSYLTYSHNKSAQHAAQLGIQTKNSRHQNWEPRFSGQLQINLLTLCCSAARQLCQAMATLRKEDVSSIYI